MALGYSKNGHFFLDPKADFFYGHDHSPQTIFFFKLSEDCGDHGHKKLCGIKIFYLFQNPGVVCVRCLRKISERLMHLFSIYYRGNKNKPVIFTLFNLELCG